MSEQDQSARFIKKIDDVYKLNEKLTSLGFTSVFDITRMPKAVFIKKYERSLNGRADAVYHLALGFAAQLKRLFRQNPTGLRVGKALKGTYTVNALLKNGPTWQGLFDDSWAAYCLSGTSEANDSPVSYLAYIYNQALSFEAAAGEASETIVPLSQRRPDLAVLNIDNDSVNQVVPAVSLVNEILSTSVSAYLGTEVDVDQTLSTTHYPNTLPYHFAHQQAKLAVRKSQSSLLDIMGQSSLAWPWFTQPASSAAEALQLASNLAPEQQNIITDVPYFSTFMLSLSDIENESGWGSLTYETNTFPINIDTNRVGYIVPLQDSGIPNNYSTLSETANVYGTVAPFPIVFSINDDDTTVNFSAYNNTTKTRPLNNPGADSDTRFLGFSYDRSNETFDPELLSSGATKSFYCQTQVDNSLVKYCQMSFTIALNDNSQSFPYSQTQLDFYPDNFGHLITSFTDISTLSTFTQSTKITAGQAEELFSQNTGGFNVVLSSNITPVNTYSSHISPFDYGSVYIHAAKTPAMTFTKADNDVTINYFTDDRADRVNRMIRLQRWLALPYDKVDLLITSVMHAEGDNNLGFYTNKNTLRALGVYHDFNQKYGVSAEQFAAFIYQVTPYAISPDTPFLDRVFNSSSLFDTPLVVDWQNFDYTLTTGRDAQIVKQISAGLGISEAQFIVLAGVVAGAQGDKDAHTLSCSLDVISAFYRLVMLPRVMGLGFVEGLALMELLNDGALLTQLAAIPVIQPIVTTTGDDGIVSETIAEGDALNNLLAFAQAAQWLQEHGLSAAECDLLLRTPTAPPVMTSAQQSFIADTNQQLQPTLLSLEQLATAGAPATDGDGNSIDWWTLLSNVVDGSGIIKNIVPADDGTTLTTLISDVTTDTKDLALSTDVIEAIANLLEQTRVTQQGIAATALAKALQVTQTLPGYLLQWNSSTVYDFLSQNWALNNISGGLQNETSSSYLLLLSQLVRYAVIARRFNLSPAFLNTFLKQPQWFGLTDASPSLNAFYLFSRYGDLLLLTPGTEDEILAYFTLVNNATFTNAATAASLLATLLDWDASEVTLGATRANPETAIAQTLPQIDFLMRLRTLWLKTNASVSPLLATAALTTQSDYAAWQQVGESWVAAQN